MSDLEQAEQLLHEAWSVIADAGWDDLEKTEGWWEAAVRWRDKWHAFLDTGKDET